MTDEEIVGLGYWCENILQSDFFSTVVQQYEQQCFGQWMSTEAKNLKEREFVFTKVRALQDFLGHMKAYAVQKDAIEKREAPSPDQDALVEGIDY